MVVKLLAEDSEIRKKIKKFYEKRRIETALSLVPSTNEHAYALDVGCAFGILAQSITKKGYLYVGLDTSKEQIKSAKSINKFIDFLIADAHHLPFRRCFELIIALELIEHLSEPFSLLKEVKHLLSDEGYLLISTPNKLSLEGFKGKIYEIVSGKRWDAWGGRGHKRIFSSTEFLNILENYFSIVRTVGYYYLPHIPFIEKLNDLYITGRHVRYINISHKPLNMFGFQTIVLCKNDT